MKRDCGVGGTPAAPWNRAQIRGPADPQLVSSSWLAKNSLVWLAENKLQVKRKRFAERAETVLCAYKYRFTSSFSALQVWRDGISRVRAHFLHGVPHPKRTWAAAVGEGKGDSVKVYLSIQLGFSHKNMNSELFFITGNFSISALDQFHLKSQLWHRCHCLVTLQARSSLSLIYFHPHG